MKNRQYEEFSEEKFNKNKNYQAIMSKVKEGKTMRSFKMSNVAAVLAVVIIVSCMAPSIYAKIQWNIQFKEYQNREFETGSGTIKEAVESGYYEEVEMDYITQDGVSSKVDSLIITDDYLEAKINFKFADGIQVDSERFSYGFAVYDDENNIYGIFTRMHLGSPEKRDKYTPYIYREIGVKYNKNDIYANQLNDASGQEMVSVSEEERNIISKITMNSTKGFPRSKKLYIRVFDLGYSMVELGQRKIEQAEDFSISDAEWIFEIDVPEKFYERRTTELKLKEEIPGVEVEKITVTEVGLVVRAKIEGMNAIIDSGKDMSGNDWQKLRNETIYISDGEGKVYYENTMGTAQTKDWIKMNYEISKNMLSKKLYLHVKVNGQQYVSELIEK